MTDKEYRQCIERLDMTPVDAARFLGVNATTSRRWAQGLRPIPMYVMMLLRVMIRYNLTPHSVTTLMQRHADRAGGPQEVRP